MAKSRANQTLEELESPPTITITAPIGEPDQHSYLHRGRCRIDVALQGPAATAFNRIHAGLLETRAVFEDGRPIVSRSDALKWLLLNAVEV